MGPWIGHALKVRRSRRRERPLNYCLDRTSSVWPPCLRNGLDSAYHARCERQNKTDHRWDLSPQVVGRPSHTNCPSYVCRRKNLRRLYSCSRLCATTRPPRVYFLLVQMTHRGRIVLETTEGHKWKSMRSNVWKPSRPKKQSSSGSVDLGAKIGIADRARRDHVHAAVEQAFQRLGKIIVPIRVTGRRPLAVYRSMRSTASNVSSKRARLSLIAAWPPRARARGCAA